MYIYIRHNYDQFKMQLNIKVPRTASVVLEESLVEKTAKVLDSLKKSIPLTLTKH